MKDNVTAWGYSNMKGHLLPLNLQLFADGGVQDPDPTVTDPAGNGGAGPITYTQEEVEKLLQSEADKRVTAALKKQKESLMKEIEKQREEDKRLAKLSAEERAKEELEIERKKLAEQKASFERDKLELQVIKELSNEGLDASFSSFLMGKDADESFDNIKNFKKVFESAVEMAVKKELGGKPPRVGGKEKLEKDPFSKENFNLTEIGRLIKEDPATYLPRLEELKRQGVI